MKKFIRPLPNYNRLSGSSSHEGNAVSCECKDLNLEIEYYGYDVNYEIIEMMGLQLAECRALQRDFNDSSVVIFNESAIKALGLKNPKEKKILQGDKRTIGGVVSFALFL